MDRSSPVLLLVAPPSPARAQVAQALSGRPVRLETAPDCAGAAQRTEELGAQGALPAAVLVGPGPGQLGLARQLRRALPPLHLVLLADPGKEEALRSALRFDPILSSHASLLSLAAPDLCEALRHLATAALQRRALRSTLDRLNAQLTRPSTTPGRTSFASPQLASLLEQSADGIFLADPTGRIVAWNAAATALFGWGGEGEGEPTLELLEATARPPLERGQLLARLLERGPLSLEVQWPRAGGQREVELSLAAVHEPGHGFLGVPGIARDVTERRAADRRRQAGYEMAHLLAEAGSLAEVAPRLLAVLGKLLQGQVAELWEVDEQEDLLRPVACWSAEGAVVESFLAATRGMTFTPGIGLPGRTWTGGIPVWVRDMTEAVFPRRHAAARCGLCTAFGFPIALGSGVLGVVCLYGAELPPPDASLLQSLESYGQQLAQFISRKRSEEALRALNESLEARVLERTRQLEEANRELEAFSFSVSHDLRAPIRHIRGFTDLLVRHAGPTLDERGGQLLRMIGEAARHASQLIEDLLSFSRMGRAELRATLLDMDRLVEECRRELAPEAAGRQVRWQVAPLPGARGDPAMLRLVWKNLLSNALKYTRPRAEALIEVEGSRARGEVLYRVRDNGVGFDMRHASRLFGVFHRLHTQEEFEGTGIGLANVQRIVQRHGGRVWAEAAPGRGAIFTFTLPGGSER